LPDVNSIMKVKEYRYHIPIYHIFWELHNGNYSARSSQNALQWVNCRDWPGFRIRYGGTLHTVKSVVRAIPSSMETSERLPDIHKGPPNLAESNGVEHANTPYSQSHAMKVCIEPLLDLSMEQDYITWRDRSHACIQISGGISSVRSECMMLLSSVRMDFWYVGTFVVVDIISLQSEA
jgi:hypothetical protein